MTSRVRGARAAPPPPALRAAGRSRPRRSPLPLLLGLTPLALPLLRGGLAIFEAGPLQAALIEVGGRYSAGEWTLAALPALLSSLFGAVTWLTGGAPLWGRLLYLLGVLVSVAYLFTAWLNWLGVL